MKKIFALMLALMLCLSMTAMAEVPSKTAADTVEVTAVTENGAEGLVVELVSDLDMTPEELAKHEALKEVADAEIEKLAEAGSVAEYFGDVADINGNTVDLAEMVGAESADDLSVYEFFGIVAFGYEDDMGKATVSFKLPTPYEDGSKVAVMIGEVVRGEEDYEIFWTANEGTVVSDGEEATVEVELAPETVEMVQNGEALVAFVSKTIED